MESSNASPPQRSNDSGTTTENSDVVMESEVTHSSNQSQSEGGGSNSQSQQPGQSTNQSQQPAQEGSGSTPNNATPEQPRMV